jgi:polyphenol oxidase
MNEQTLFLTLPDFSAVRGLVHGFGTRELTEAAMAQHQELRDFKPVVMNQIHSDIIHVIEEKPEEKLVGDALITKVPGILICVRTADCLPLLIADTKSGLMAAVHCGWKGTAKRLAAKVVRILKETFGCDPAFLLAALGPAIGPDCYEVGEDVVKEFGRPGYSGELIFSPQGKGKFLLDLRKANRLQLEEEGLAPGRILSQGSCTHCDPCLFSYRRDRAECGRLLNFIGRTNTP